MERFRGAGARHERRRIEDAGAQKARAIYARLVRVVSDDLRRRPRGARCIRHGVLAMALAAAVGCGGVPYAVRVVQASNALTRAEQLGAATRAPYEYHYALEHLRKAREQAARSEYGDAGRLAETAREYANRAVQLAQRVEPVVPMPRVQP